MSKRSNPSAFNPFALGQKMLEAQQAQIKLADQMLKSARESAAFQQKAIEAGTELVRAQKRWLALWGIK